MKNGDIYFGQFLSRDFLFQVSGNKGIVLAHNLEGHIVHAIANLDKFGELKHKELKKVSPDDLPLYLDMKVLNPEFLNLIKDHNLTRS